MKNGFRPILCVCVCVSIDTMLNFDGDVDANVKCEHSIKVRAHYDTEKNALGDPDLETDLYLLL